MSGLRTLVLWAALALSAVAADAPPPVAPGAPPPIEAVQPFVVVPMSRMMELRAIMEQMVAIIEAQQAEIERLRTSLAPGTGCI